MIPAPVGYVRASSLDEALDALAEPDARALAGGQSLIPAMKLRLARPSLLVDLAGLDLRGISPQNGGLRIGALTTWDDLARDDRLAGPGLASVRDCAAQIGDLQVRNLGTVGGGLAHGDPAADFPAVALALDMRALVRSAAGEREVAVDELLLGPFTTSLEPQELIVGIRVPAPAAGSGSAYVSVENPASGFALAGAAAVVAADGTSRVAVTGAAGRPLLGPFDGAPPDVPGDRFASAEYRRHLVEVVVRRALELAESRREQAR